MQDLIITDPRAPLPVGTRVRGTVGDGFAVIVRGVGGVAKMPAAYVAPAPTQDDRIAVALGVAAHRAVSVATLAAMGSLLSGCHPRYTGMADAVYKAGLVDGAAVVVGLIAVLVLVERAVMGAVYRRRLRRLEDAEWEERARDTFYAGSTCLARQIERP